jgi:subtilase family serine protease
MRTRTLSRSTDDHDPGRRRRHLTRIGSVVVVAATVSGLTLLGASGAQAAPRVIYAGAIPSWATSAKAAGTPAATATIQAQVFLTMKDLPGATALASAVSTPGSPSYRQYVTPATWIDSYAPTQAALDTVAAQLKGAGITKYSAPTSRLFVTFRATTTQLNNLFKTRLETYNVDGQKLIGPATAPSLPTGVAGSVAGVSIDQGRLLTRPKSVTQASAAAAAASGSGSASASLSLGALDRLAQPAQPKAVTVKTPCSTYTSQKSVAIPTAYGRTAASTANCGYTPAQLRTAYGIPALAADGSRTGTGQTVAVVGVYASPTLARDVGVYSQKVGEPGFANGQYINLAPNPATFTDQAACGQPSGWQGEQTLDVEAIHALAPGAKILYSGATDCGAGTDLALSKILDDRLATIVSNSYGGSGEPDTTDLDNKNYVDGEVNLQLQAAAEGVGLAFASGDDGDEKANIGRISTDFPASSPWVTAVGGTSLGLTKNNAKQFETGWGNRLDPIVSAGGKKLKYAQTLPGTLFAGGAGGGKSTLFKRPGYQSAQVVPASIGAGQRLVPDVASLADPFSGLLVGYSPITNNTTLKTGAFATSVIGGTSLASPLYAAEVAAIQQKTGTVIGFANPLLYSLAASTPSTFVDILPRSTPAAVAYSNSTTSYLVTLGLDSSLPVTKGYDTVTGLGELNMSSLGGFAAPSK